jgi:3-methyladenine DNA glycosylase AlkD
VSWKVKVSEHAASIEQALRERGTPERAAQEQAYLKSPLTFLGASVPDTRSVVRTFLRAHPELTAENVRGLAAALWDAPIFERRAAAVMLLIADVARSRPEDIVLVEAFVREARTWALVDSLSCDVSGDLVVRFPELGATLDRWAADDDFWVRRAALLSLLVPLRKGGGDWTHFVRLAEPMLGEREFFIRKALGWVLRETGKRRPELVEEWLRPRAAVVSRLTLREAIKPLPAEAAAELLALAGARPASAGATGGKSNAEAGPTKPRDPL